MTPSVGSYVYVIKNDRASRAKYRTAAQHEWVPGQENEGLTPPICYMAEGKLTGPIKPGRRLLVDRVKRNGVEVPGKFSSSIIMEVDTSAENPIYVHTENSVYQVTTKE